MAFRREALPSAFHKPKWHDNAFKDLDLAIDAMSKYVTIVISNSPCNTTRSSALGCLSTSGDSLLPDYFARVWQLLRPGGVFLNHGIAASATWKRLEPSFADRYLFPDGELVPVSTSLRAAEESGFEVRDVENLREHYALTVHSWLLRLEANATEAREITDDTTYRIWRLYMVAGEHRFRSGRLNLHQLLLSKSLHGESGLPPAPTGTVTRLIRNTHILA